MKSVRGVLKRAFEKLLDRGRSGKTDDWVFLNLISFGLLGLFYSYHRYKMNNPCGLNAKTRFNKLKNRYVRL